MKTFRTQSPAPVVGAKRTHSRRVLLGISATTYLALAIWLGPHLAVARCVTAE
jgi:hypothetical protein